ncbi:hypothetical protein [Mycoplasma sp. Sp33II]|uniref:hypothetical protein n=1 Tax=unclassified Mycoplasma TaxID=2683645 RepID=UPI003AAB68ED
MFNEKKLRHAKTTNIITAVLFLTLVILAIVFFAIPAIVTQTASHSSTIEMFLVSYIYGVYVCSIFAVIVFISEITNIIFNSIWLNSLTDEQESKIRSDMIIWFVLSIIPLFAIANINLAVKQNKLLKINKVN